jgi:hypothetical protein
VRKTPWALAAALVMSLALAACGSASSASHAAAAPASSRPTASAPAAKPTSGSGVTSPAPSGLPCNPASSSCWIPQTAQYPQEQYISYEPAQAYTTVTPLVKALGCSITPAIGDYTPSAQAVDCTDSLVNGIRVGLSVSAEASAAGIDQNNATSTANDEFYVFGPGWVAGSSGEYSDAVQVQKLAGGEIICFSDGVTVDGIAACSH